MSVTKNYCVMSAAMMLLEVCQLQKFKCFKPPPVYVQKNNNYVDGDADTNSEKHQYT